MKEELLVQRRKEDKMVWWSKKERDLFSKEHDDLIGQAESAAMEAQDALIRQRSILKDLRDEYASRMDEGD